MGSPAYNKERYHWYKSHGICANCGRTWAEPGKVLCAMCARKNAASQKKYDPDGSRTAAAHSALRAARKAAGLCFECGRPRDGEWQRCTKCLTRMRESAKMYRLRQRIKKESIHE